MTAALSGKARAVLVLLGLALLFAVPSFTRNEYVLALGVSFATFAVLSGGLNLVYGYAGLLSFAQVGFFGIGAYAAALLVTDAGWPVWAGALAGALLAAVLGLGIGYSSLRLSRHAFAIVTLSFSLLCMIVSRDWVSLTRGAMGIPGLAVPQFDLPGGLRWRLNKPADFYYLLLGLATMCLGVIHAVVTSRIGRALKAVKMNEPLAQSQGIDPLRYKLMAVTLSAFMTGLMGGFFVFYLTIVDPSIFDFYYTETMLIMVILGGAGSFWGVLFSSAVLTVLPELLRFSTDLRMILYGAILIVAMLVFPGGIGGWFERRRIERWRKVPYGGRSAP
ncbi:MAG: branched-chain amino acid ABC transporter permease [Comamonadaceae bacterium]|nr:MAG: branched-chain amino acid ABC transporter permease [Comamonadaceae bacterium]